jgi:nicotinamide mononucleotide transporter
MPAEKWEELPDEHTIEAHLYQFSEGQIVAFDHEANEDEVLAGVKEVYAEEAKGLWSAALALGLLAISLAVVTFFATCFTTYEKIWFTGIMVMATLFAIFMPEESANGVNGIWIMLLYLFDTLLNILCELLLSKQSKWNFIVSVLVEITEILICLVLAYRWATMAVTLFFWLPIDILSFINWHRHPDKREEELTAVRKLKGWQEVLVLVGVAVWTIVVGYFISELDIATDLFGGNELRENVVCYLDACASAVGIANGLFIFFRLKEQWVAWITVSVLEALINILTGQWVLLPLKLGYFTNSVYGLNKWSKYIKHKEDEGEEEKAQFF